MPKQPRHILPLVAIALLTACKLIDQTTFAPNPEPPRPQQIQALPQQDRRLPLLTIRYDVPTPSYGNLLNYAVQSAESRNRSIEYDVVSVVPARESPETGAQSALE